MSSWRPLAAGTIGVFLIVLAFLAGQLKSGGDPGLSRNAAAATSQPTTAPQPQQDFGAGPQGPDPQAIDPQAVDPGATDPYGSGSSDGASPDLAPPTTHQS